MLWLVCVCIAPLLLANTAWSAGDPLRSPAASADGPTAAGESGMQALHDVEATGSIFARHVQPGACSDQVVTFAFSDRPTIEVAINGESRPLLFDTGTNTCLLRLSSAWPEPSRLLLCRDDPGLAQLEGKHLGQADGGVLHYALAPLVRLGGIRLRDVPWRLYSNNEDTDAEVDYAGAFAPVLLRDWLIEVNNTASEIRLQKRQGWLPQRNALMLPLLELPRGLFVPLTIGGRQLWFHFDTGFSGGIGVTPEVLAQQADIIVPAPDAGEQYQGWHKQFTYKGVVIKELRLPAYPGLSWARSDTLVLHDVAGIAYRDAYRELKGYSIGGIAGSGFWQRFDYVLDYELGRLYLWPRENWQAASSAPKRGEDPGAGAEK